MEGISYILRSLSKPERDPFEEMLENKSYSRSREINCPPKFL